MAEAIQPFQEGTEQNQAVRFYSRARRRSLAGLDRMFRTHRFVGTTEIGVEPIATSSVFSNLGGSITFKTSIRIDANAGVHTGIVFEFGAGSRGCGLFLEDDRITWRAGGLSTIGATAIFLNGAELPPGLELELVVAVNSGNGKVRMWGNGAELARDQAAAGALTVGWTGTGTGTFAKLPANVVSEIPVGARVAPDGFTVIEPLSAYVGQLPRHFVG